MTTDDRRAPPKERPILFSGPMVRAILDGRKTQTRRIIKPQPPRQPICDAYDGKWYVEGETWLRSCPYGQPGDRLWVRETYRQGPSGIEYRADSDAFPLPPWRPAIHMPRWASRINLEITAICVERLRSIPLADIEAEGIPYNPMGQKNYRNDGYQRTLDFQWMWDEINDKRGFGWHANPWIWVVSFRCRAALRAVGGE